MNENIDGMAKIIREMIPESAHSDIALILGAIAGAADPAAKAREISERLETENSK